ncbi:MAG TPA: helix-turn-helix domain-containing protein [Phenylobacterium sp.]
MSATDRKAPHDTARALVANPPPMPGQAIDTGWAGALELGSTWALWRGAVGDAALHRHFAAQAVLSAEPLEVFDADGRAVSARCLLIDPLTPHRLAPAPSAELIFLEPSRYVARELEAQLRRLREVPSLALLRGGSGDGFWTAWLSSADRAPKPLDPRIEAALRLLEDDLSEGPTPLRRAASVAGLSPERFRHRFADEVGLPYRRFLLWRRLRLAAQHLAGGRDVTAAAHAAGFADAAHLARTLKATFGVTASQLNLRSSSAT